MQQNASQRMQVVFNGAGYAGNAESNLLGGFTPALSQTRVMAANYQSSFVRPADLDAFLQGYIQS